MLKVVEENYAIIPVVKLAIRVALQQPSVNCTAILETGTFDEITIQQ